MVKIVMRKHALALASLLLLGGVDLCASAADPPQSASRVAPAGRDDGSKKIVASGTVMPEELVDVCPQVSGKIESLGVDSHAKGTPVSSGSLVAAGDILAQIDRAPYLVRLEQELAGCSLAQAELAQAQAKLEAADARWQQAQEGQKKGSIPESEFTPAKLDLKVAKAAVAVAEAALDRNKARLKEAQLNLDYTTIKSPIDGAVIACRAAVGQTATVGSAAPSLFLIADTKRLQVWASVNEADIMQVHEQQPVHFTIDAFPGEVFEGKVKQIRLNATMTQNTVAYTVVVAILGKTDKLLPYLTANVVFE